jgi:tetratricopeptide (TPR) repeat protein
MVALILGMSSGGWAQTNSALLEKGIYAEETLGNLSDAINIYLQIVGNTDAARPIAAQALYRLGICYLKSGKRADAQAAFSKLTRSYPEQKELIAAIPGLPIPPEVQLRPIPWQDG